MSDAKEIARLERKHRDIAVHGAGALALQATKEDRQQEMSRFVDHHGISCFKCGSIFNAWAKTAMGPAGPWAICVRCVRKP